MRSKTVGFLIEQIDSWKAMRKESRRQLIIEVHHTKRTVGDALKASQTLIEAEVK